jgi:malonyl-CoA O-methyltransferase
MEIKQGIRRNFARRVATYDRYACAQRLMAQGLLALVGPVVSQARSILEIGCGTGQFTQLLRRLNAAASLVALDLDEVLVAAARRRVGNGCRTHWLVADGEAWVLGPFDLIIGNATFQWLTRPGEALANYFESLNPGGLVAFSTLGPETFRELASSLAQAGGATIPAQNFLAREDWSRLLEQAGFQEIRVVRETVTATFESVGHFLKALQATGATNPRPRAFSPRVLKAMAAAYQQNFGLNGGGIPATYELIWAAARK